MSPRSNPESNPESNFLTKKKSLLSRFSVKKLLSKLLLGETRKSLFSHFRVTLNYSGFRGFWEVSIFLNRPPSREFVLSCFLESILSRFLPWPSFPKCLAKNLGKPPKTPRIVKPLQTQMNTGKTAENHHIALIRKDQGQSKTLSKGRSGTIRVVAIQHCHLKWIQKRPFFEKDSNWGSVVAGEWVGGWAVAAKQSHYTAISNGAIGSLHLSLYFWGEAFSLTVGASLLTVKLLCLQSLGALLRRTYPL